MSPKWDYISVFCFAALVLGLLIVGILRLRCKFYLLAACAFTIKSPLAVRLSAARALVLLFAGLSHNRALSKGWPGGSPSRKPQQAAQQGAAPDRLQLRSFRASFSSLPAAGELGRSVCCASA